MSTREFTAAKTRRIQARLAGAVYASRRHRVGGTAARYVSLWDSKNPQAAQCVGHVRSETMDAAVTVGLWEHDISPQVEYSDTFTEHWWRV